MALARGADETVVVMTAGGYSEAGTADQGCRAVPAGGS